MRQQTGTAADLLSYASYIHVSGDERYERVTTANEEWIVQDWDGERYYLRFDNNFTKKHLVTFSKDKHRLEVEAYYEWLNSGKTRASVENWGAAEKGLMTQKMEQTVLNRSLADLCTCTHRWNQHPGGNACTSVGCPCPKFVTVFSKYLEDQGRANTEPLAGVATPKNTFLILNWVPKAEFEFVVVQSLQAVEKPAGWGRGDPLAKSVGDEEVLRWDFGPARVGAIVIALKNHPPAHWVRKQGCYVKARKTATDWARQTWQIFHMETGGTHAPF